VNPGIAASVGLLNNSSLMALTATVADESDEALARHVMERPGDARQQEAELFARFAPRVRLYGLRHLRSDDAAQELTQRVVVRAIEKLRKGEVNQPERIGSFVLGVAKLTALEMRRAAQRETPTLPETIEVEVPPAFSEPLALDRLAGCLQALSERGRSVLVLTFFQQQTAQEICSALSMSTSNVRVVRHRAIEQLRDCMGVVA